MKITGIKFLLVGALFILLNACSGEPQVDGTYFSSDPAYNDPASPSTDPVPPTTDPVPPTTDPDSSPTNPDTPSTDPVPPPTDPLPPTTEPEPPTTDPVPPPSDPVPPPVSTFTTSSTSQFLNELCISWEYDLAGNADVIGFRIYDAQGSIVCSTEDLQILHVDCAYSASQPASTFTMTAYDNGGNESAHSAPFNINKAPVADIVANGTDTSVQFDASASHDFGGGSIVAYSWDFGDGNTATGATASHDYQPGVYTATLEVVDNDGATTSTEVTFTIS